jgi:hypothetical protein
MDHILDLDAYPLHRLDSVEGRDLLARCQADLASDGMFTLPNLIRPEAVDRALEEVNPILATAAFEHRQRHNIYFKAHVDGLSPDHPALTTAETVNRKICADQIPGAIVLNVYEWPPLAAFLAAVMAKPALYLMDDPLARVNIMTYGAGEALNWHFDRSEFTTTLLLSAPEAGGAFQYRSNLRSETDPNYDGVARLMRGEDPEVASLALTPGSLNVFRGKNTAHRVSPVKGPRPRTIAVFSYYETPGVTFPPEDRLRFYGRTG